MGERKLNFNAPLMSVRRFSSPLASEDRRNRKVIESPMRSRRFTLPICGSETDQVTEPVAVPFNWEQIPGRAKDGNRPEPHPQPLEEKSVTPKLPPVRFFDSMKKPLEKEYEDTNRLSYQIKAHSSKDKATKSEFCNEGINEKGSSDLEDENDDVYSDAFDKLSPTDSFSMNCSSNGLSGSGGLEMKRSGNFSTDPQTLDFMMRRFLPAARAMALEPPQYASRKPSVTHEQPRQVNRVVSGDRKPLCNQNKSNMITVYGQNKEEEESEDEDSEYDNSGNISAKGCGLFTRLRLKNSLCLLNPLPGMKVTQGPVSSTGDIVRQGKTAYIRSHNETAQKHAWDNVSKSKLANGFRSGELQKVENKLAIHSRWVTRSGELQNTVENKQTSQSRRFTRSGELQKTVGNKQTGESRRFTRSGELHTTAGGLSPYRRSWGAGVSPYRNEASQSPFRGVRFPIIPKGIQNSKANRFNLNIEGSDKDKQASGSMSPAVEKTLYVDTVNIAKKSFLNSSSSDIKGCMDSAGEYTSLVSRQPEETTTGEFVFQHSKCLDVLMEGSILEPDGSGDADLSSESEISILKGQEVRMEGSGQDQGLIERSRSLECSKVTTEGNLNIESHQILKGDDQGNADASSVQSTVPPPLPKSPSESWLWRTLPSISSSNLFSLSNLGSQVNPKKQDPKTSSTKTKWETIVKTSHLHHDHVRFSQELIAHVSQQPKT